MKYEYSVKFFSKLTGKCVGFAMHIYKTLEDAEYFASDQNIRFPEPCDEARVFRREVGEWEEIK